MASFSDTLAQIGQAMQSYTNNPRNLTSIMNMQGIGSDVQSQVIQNQGGQIDIDNAMKAREAADYEALQLAQAKEILAQSGGEYDPEIMMELATKSPELAKVYREITSRPAASSTIGKIQADIDAGLIDEQTGTAALKKATTIAPVYDPVSGNMIYAGGNGGGFTAPDMGGTPAPSGGESDIPPEFAGNRNAYQAYLNALAASKAKEGNEENTVKKQKAEGMRDTALTLINDLLADPDAVRSAVGTVSSQTPTIFDSTADVENKIGQLRSILTAENLGLMTGVLSETDLKVIADIAGGGLKTNRSEDGFIKELLSLKSKFGGDKTQKYQEGQTATGANGQKLVYTGGKWRQQ